MLFGEDNAQLLGESGTPLVGESNAPLVMGILNVTPDSFSDGGKWLDADAAVAHGVALAQAGADVIDVGGESTRPGAVRVDSAEELRRVLPVIRELNRLGHRVSVDTMRASTAHAAIEAGAEIVNDVSAGSADNEMVRVVAASAAKYVAMHWRGHSDQMDSRAHYTDVASDVRDELAARVDSLVAAGLPRERIVLDPGLGFAKHGNQNWDLLSRLDVLQELGFPVLVGASRKRFVGELIPTGPVVERDLPTAVISVLCAQAGVWGLRVHDVAATRIALDVLRAWKHGHRG